MTGNAGIGRSIKLCAVVAMIALAAAARAQSETAASTEPGAAAALPLLEDPMRDSAIPTEWTPQSWQQHIEEERWRIRNEAMLRSLRPPEPLRPTVEEQARVASEQVFSDSTLARGDIIVTTKGLFVFKGQKSEQRLPDDFEAVQSSRLTRPGDAGK
jgi:hypothetical protein